MTNRIHGHVQSRSLVEILKGPASLLFGLSGTGAAVNYVTQGGRTTGPIVNEAFNRGLGFD